MMDADRLAAGNVPTPDAAAAMRGTARRAVRALAFVLIGIPPAIVAWVLLGDYGAFFWDAKTLPCGIEAAMATGRPNAYLDPAYPGACAGYRFAYTAPPAITAVLATIARGVGIDALVGLYAALYFVALTSLGWVAWRFHRSLARPLLVAFAYACGAFVFETASGNLAVAFGGLLTGLILAIERRTGLVVTLCVLGALFKPHFALYLLVPLFAGSGYLAVCFAAAVVSVWYAADAALHPQAFADWLTLVLSLVHGEAHFGFMKLMEFVGYAKGHWLFLAAGYVTWCTLLIGLTWRLCTRLESPVDRAFAALACVTLLLPRLKEYDCLVLVPLFFWLSWRVTAGVRRWLHGAVVLAGFLVPAIWWWGRKLALLGGDAVVTLRAVAELKWLAQVQGVFLAVSVAIVFIVMLAALGTRRASGSVVRDPESRLPATSA